MICCMEINCGCMVDCVAIDTGALLVECTCIAPFTGVLAVELWFMPRLMVAEVLAVARGARPPDVGVAPRTICTEAPRVEDGRKEELDEVGVKVNDVDGAAGALNDESSMELLPLPGTLLPPSVVVMGPLLL